MSQRQTNFQSSLQVQSALLWPDVHDPKPPQEASVLPVAQTKEQEERNVYRLHQLRAQYEKLQGSRGVHDALIEHEDGDTGVTTTSYIQYGRNAHRSSQGRLPFALDGVEEESKDEQHETRCSLRQFPEKIGLSSSIVNPPFGIDHTSDSGSMDRTRPRGGSQDELTCRYHRSFETGVNGMMSSDAAKFWGNEGVANGILLREKEAYAQHRAGTRHQQNYYD